MTLDDPIGAANHTWGANQPTNKKQYWNDGIEAYNRDQEILEIVNTNDEAIIGLHLVPGSELKVGMTVRSYDNVHFLSEGKLFHTGLNWWIMHTESWIEGRVEEIKEIEGCPCGSPHVTIHADKASHPQGFHMDRLYSGGEKKLYHPHIGHYFVIMSQELNPAIDFDLGAIE